MASVNVFVLTSINICVLVDSLVIGRMLGSEAMAAAGFFSPAATAIGIYSMLVMGTQIVCGNLIGAGLKDQVQRLFFSSFLSIAVPYGIGSAVCVIFRDRLAAMLGAQGPIKDMLSAYILGYMPGVPFMALNALLVALISFNNGMRRSYISAGIMVAGNAAGDILFARAGMFGIGLSSTLSSALALIVLIPAYCRRDKLLRFQASPYDPGLVGRAAVCGLPTLMLTGGLVIKNTLMIRTMGSYYGADGVAVVNVLASVCCLIGILAGGCIIAYSTLASLYFGEEDRSSVLSLFRVALFAGECCCLMAVIAVFLNADLLSGLFFPDGGAAALSLSGQMFRLGFFFFPCNMLLNLLLGTRQAQGKMKLINILTAAETSFIGITVFAAVPLWGSNAAWLANLWVDIACIVIVVAASWILAKRIDFLPDTLLQIPDGFGASREEYREYSVGSLSDTVSVSEAVIRFCRAKGITDRLSLFAGLCVEEMTRNIVTYGFAPDSRSYVDVRVAVRNGLVLRIRDNCPEFDPMQRIRQYEPEIPERNIGIRLVSKLADHMEYYNCAGMNTLIIRFDE